MDNRWIIEMLSCSSTYTLTLTGECVSNQVNIVGCAAYQQLSDGTTVCDIC